MTAARMLDNSPHTYKILSYSLRKYKHLVCCFGDGIRNIFKLHENSRGGEAGMEGKPVYTSGNGGCGGDDDGRLADRGGGKGGYEDSGMGKGGGAVDRNRGGGGGLGGGGGGRGKG